LQNFVLFVFYWLSALNISLKCGFAQGCDAVFLELPEGFKVTHNVKDSVLKLKKALYSLKTSPKSMEPRI
jgi:hypothetical protein